MKKHICGLLFVALASGLGSLFVSAPSFSDGASRAQDKPAWEVSGIFSEACECNPPCPCWSGKEPTQHHCHNVQVYKIEKGRYGRVSLDGLVVVVAWVSPEGEIMEQSAGHSVLVALYVDRSTTAAQREAVEEIWRKSLLPPFKAGKGGVKAVNFQEADVRTGRAVVVIPGTLNFNVQKGSGQPMNSPDPQIRSLRVARSVRYRYSDYGMNWNYPGKHAAFARFHAQSPPPPG